MILLTGQQIDDTIAYRRIYFFGGLALMVLHMQLPRGFGFGFVTGFALCGLGIYAFSFRRWRTESGIWMLAGLLVTLLTPCYGYFTYWRCWEALQQPFGNLIPQQLIWVSTAIDISIAMSIFWKQVSLALAVGIKNWQCTKNSISK